MKNKLEDLIHQQLFVSNSYQDMMKVQEKKVQGVMDNNTLVSSLGKNLTGLASDMQLENIMNSNLTSLVEKQFTVASSAVEYYQDMMKIQEKKVQGVMDNNTLVSSLEKNLTGLAGDAQLKNIMNSSITSSVEKQFTVASSAMEHYQNMIKAQEKKIQKLMSDNTSTSVLAILEKQAALATNNIGVSGLLNIANQIENISMLTKKLTSVFPTSLALEKHQGIANTLTDVINDNSSMFVTDIVKKYYSNLSDVTNQLDSISELTRKLTDISNISSLTAFEKYIVDLNTFNAIPEALKVFDEQMKYYKQLDSCLSNDNDNDIDIIFERDATADDDIDSVISSNLLIQVICSILDSIKIIIEQPVSSKLKENALQQLRIMLSPSFILPIIYSYYLFLHSASDADMQSVKKQLAIMESNQTIFFQKLENTLKATALDKLSDNEKKFSCRVQQACDVYSNSSGAIEDKIFILQKDEIVDYVTQTEEWIKVQFMDYVMHELRTGWILKEKIQLLNSPIEEKQTLFAEDDEVMSHFQDSLKLNRRLGELLAK